MAKLLGWVYVALFVCSLSGFLAWGSTRPILATLGGMLLGNGFLLVAFIGLALIAVASLSEGVKGRVVVVAGGLHGAAHVGLVLAAALLFRDLYPFAPGWRFWVTLAVAAIGMFLVGRYVGIGVMALYFWLAEKAGVNTNEALAAQSIESHKNFLRLHVTAKELTVYPFGICEVVRKDEWEFNKEGDPGTSLLKPKPELAPRIHLIEQPIVIPWSVQPPYPSAEREQAAIDALKTAEVEQRRKAALRTSALGES
jgi:hypothetical protein